MKRAIFISVALLCIAAGGPRVRRGYGPGTAQQGGGPPAEPSTPTIDTNYPYSTSTTAAIGGGGSDVDANRWKFTIPATTSGPTTIIVGISYFSSADPNTCGTAQALHSAGLTWTPLAYVYANGASTQFFWTTTASAISATELGFWAGWGASCTGTFTENAVTVWALHGACGSGTGAYTTYYQAFGNMATTFTTTGAGNSFVAWVVGEAANEGSTFVPVAGNTSVGTFDGSSITWISAKRTALTSGPGAVNIGTTTNPAAFGWGYAALEVLPASCL